MAKYVILLHFYVSLLQKHIPLWIWTDLTWALWHIHCDSFHFSFFIFHFSFFFGILLLVWILWMCYSLPLYNLFVWMKFFTLIKKKVINKIVMVIIRQMFRNASQQQFGFIRNIFFLLVLKGWYEFLFSKKSYLDMN